MDNWAQAATDGGVVHPALDEVAPLIWSRLSSYFMTPPSWATHAFGSAAPLQYVVLLAFSRNTNSDQIAAANANNNNTR